MKKYLTEFLAWTIVGPIAVTYVTITAAVIVFSWIAPFYLVWKLFF